MERVRKLDDARNRRPLHELSGEDLENFWVTRSNQFKDSKWYFDNATPGARKTQSTINWCMKLPLGGNLLDPGNSEFLLWWRKLIATMYWAPRNRISPAPGSMMDFVAGIKWLTSWMKLKGLRYPHELNPTVIAEYIEDLPIILSEESESRGISESQIFRAIYILAHLWRQREVLSKLGVRPMPSNPFRFENASAISRRIATRPEGWIQPLPDQIAVAMFNRASWFLGAPAQDVIRILGRPLSRGTKDSKNAYGSHSEINGQQYSRELNNLSRLPSCALGEPGYAAEMKGIASPQIPPSTGLAVTQAQLFQDRQLWEGLRDACALLIQGSTGMRISELLGIKAGVDESTGLPSGVRIEESITGIYEWFVIRTPLAKTQRAPRAVDWVLGMRLKGSSELPISVVALLTLNKIYEPWRTNAETDRLFLSLRSGYGLTDVSARLTPMAADRIRQSYKRFFLRWIDWEAVTSEEVQGHRKNELLLWKESKGAIFTSHMLRKTWAQFVLAVDSRLLPAIGMQFHHLSLAMTEKGYIGNNPFLVEAIDSVSIQQRNQMIFEVVTGESALAGRMGEQLESALADLSKKVGGSSTVDAWERVVEACDEQDLRIFLSPHGKCCPTRPSEMRCHNETDSPMWVRSEPNFSTRSPNLCAGCACFILDAKHQKFWEDRYRENQIAFRKAARIGLADQYRVVSERAQQARTLLKKLDADIASIDNQVDLSCESGND